MPLVSSAYQPPFYLRNSHLATVMPSMLRKVNDITYERQRLITTDEDFVDLDWIKGGHDRLVVISHGLEGSADRPYVRGMARYFHREQWDVLAWNCRSCSGELNYKARFYHHGATEDLEQIIDEVKGDYQSIVLVGFSMGGSITLKYLGEQGLDIPPVVKAAAVYSVPVDLKSSVDELAKRGRGFYRKRFLRKLEAKIRQKAELFPDEVTYTDFKQIRYFPDFDNLYTAPLHGFADANDFYNKASARHYMYDTRVPVLLCNAVNDPFLGEACYPYEVCRDHPYIYLETPSHGGHVGFSLAGKVYNYMEWRAVDFASKFSVHGLSDHRQDVL